MAVYTHINHAELIELAQACARTTFAGMAERVGGFVARLAGWDALPGGFDISSERWIEAEAAIDRAAQAGDLKTTCELCDDYSERVEKFLREWELLMSKKARAA